MKLGALVLLGALASALQAADLPSFDFKTNVFPLPPLMLGDAVSNKAPAMTFHSPAFPTLADRFPPAFTPRFDPKMRIAKPRSDIDFKMIIKEPAPNLDPKFVEPAPQGPAKLGGGK